MRCEKWMLALAMALALPAAAVAQAQQPPKAPPRAKKVWTNDDIEMLRNRSHISSFEPGGAAAPSGGEAAAAPQPGPPTEERLRAEKLSKRIAGLREELAAVESELKTLRGNSSTGRTTGEGLSTATVPGGMNTQDKIAALETKRKQLASELSDAEDEARRMGFSAGEIRTLPAAAEPPSGLTKEEDDAKAVERLRTRAAELRAQIQQVEADIARLRAVITSGQTVPLGTAIVPGAPGTTTQEQLAGLETKRRNLQRQLDELEDEARRQGLRL